MEDVPYLAREGEVWDIFRDCKVWTNFFRSSCTVRTIVLYVIMVTERVYVTAFMCVHIFASIDINIMLIQLLFELLCHDESSEVTPTPKIAEFRKWWQFLWYIKNKQQFSSWQWNLLWHNLYTF